MHVDYTGSSRLPREIKYIKLDRPTSKVNVDSFPGVCVCSTKTVCAGATEIIWLMSDDS